MPDKLEFAAQDLRHGERLFKPGDKVNLDHYVRVGSLPERNAETLRRTSQVLPLTRENYALVYARLPPGHVGEGFTLDQLLELGIIDAAPKPASKPAPPAGAAPVQTKPHRATSEPPEIVPPTEQTVEYRGAFLTPRARGAGGLGPIWHLTDSVGTKRRDKGFGSLANGKAHIDALIAADLASDPGPATPGAGKAVENQGDDHVVQP